MKTQFTVDKEFIKEAYNSACYDWKAKLKNKFPEAFQSELEVGKWYKNGDKGGEKSIACVVEVNPNPNPNIGYNAEDFKGYGFDLNGKFHPFKDCFDWGSNNWIKATKEEVETALIAEAKRRGFKEGVKCISTKNMERTCGDDIYYNGFEFNQLLFSNCSVFDNGKWAEIISEPIEVTLEQIAEKFNVNVEQLKIKK